MMKIISNILWGKNTDRQSETSKSLMAKVKSMIKYFDEKLPYLLKMDPRAVGCECGAHTPFGPVHSEWCPMHEPYVIEQPDICNVCNTERIAAGCSQCNTAENDYCPKCHKCWCCGKTNDK
jgi:preprotein translocase subunit Sec61beta